ncbi:MAG: hypothetical protein M3O64_02380 [Chloroflexota bacterium]|nr:hypothetical protein [Chloroflexota bacterium]
MLRTTAAFVLALMIGAFALPATTAAAAEPAFAPSAIAQTTCDPSATSTRGGAAGLVAAVVQAAANVNVCDVQILNNSVNNLLQNADINVLQNILNNSPILNGLSITVTDINVLGGTTTITLLGGTVLTLTQ